MQVNFKEALTNVLADEAVLAVTAPTPEEVAAHAIAATELISMIMALRTVGFVDITRENFHLAVKKIELIQQSLSTEEKV